MVYRFFIAVLILLCLTPSSARAQQTASTTQTAVTTQQTTVVHGAPAVATAPAPSASPTLALAPVAAPVMTDMNIAVLRTIDKVSARTRTFEVPVNKTVRFGQSLFIRVRACRKSTPLERQENAAFLQIWEKSASDGTSHWVFSGWMFSSNPSLSTMENPVYDIWVLDCKNNVTSSKPEVFSSEKAPAETSIDGNPKASAVPSAAAPSPENKPE